MARFLLTLAAALSIIDEALAASKPAADPCAKIAGQAFVAPADALACYKSFPFNATIRDNVVSAVSRVFDFYTFEDYYYNSPAPFQESTVDIRGELARISKTKYANDYEFNSDLSNLTTSLNDGHTAWFPNCYQTFESLLPAPIALLEVKGKEGVYVVPDLVDFLPLVGDGYLDYFKKLGFNWQRLAGAQVLEIEGQGVYDYIDLIAHKQSGNYLDHGVRVNSVVSSYRIQANGYSQRFGDLAGSLIIEKPGLHFKLITANSTKAETLFIPYATEYIATTNFTDSASYWATNCAADESTNGEDYYPDGKKAKLVQERKLRAKANIVDNHNGSAVGLPPKYQPSIPTVGGAAGVVKSYILPGNTTGVIFVGSFEPDDYAGFQTDVDSAIKSMKSAGVTKLLVDVTNNGGGYICLGEFLATYLAGTNTYPYGGFQSTLRANPLAKKVVTNLIARNATQTYYYPNGFAFLNDTVYPGNYNYYKPSLPLVVNSRSDQTSQRFHDVCTPYDIKMPKNPPFDLQNVAIVGNSNCASTCALFTTVMAERHNTKIAAVGGKPGEVLQYKGMAGNQVLEFADLKSEIKTARLNNDSLAPPDLLVNGNMRVNWRTAWSYLDESKPIAYVSEPAKYRFPYTTKTYNNPQALWEEAATKLLS